MNLPAAQLRGITALRCTGYAMQLRFTVLPATLPLAGSINHLPLEAPFGLVTPVFKSFCFTIMHILSAMNVNDR